MSCHVVSCRVVLTVRDSCVCFLLSHKVQYARKDIQNCTQKYFSHIHAPKSQPNCALQVAPLARTENAWAPHSLDASAIKAQDEQERKYDMLLKKAGGDLNKITPEKFDKISDRLIDLAKQLGDKKLPEFISLIFMRVQEQHHFSEMYAKLCSKMGTKPANGGEIVCLWDIVCDIVCIFLFLLQTPK